MTAAVTKNGPIVADSTGAWDYNAGSTTGLTTAGPASASAFWIPRAGTPSTYVPVKPEWSKLPGGAQLGAHQPSA